MLDWTQYLSEIKSRIGLIGKLSPDVVRGYRAISDAKFQNPKLEPKTRELIALAVAVTNRCDGCIVVHVEAAKKLGATQEEVMEALSVAVAVNAGTALIFSARTMDAFEKLST